MRHRRKKKTGEGKVRVAKHAKARKGRRAQCTCVSRSGVPKVAYTSRWKATGRAGATMGPEGKMWQIYKCPDGAGFHIGTVRWDPWA